MAAPILWAPGKMRSFCRKSYVHKIPRFRGGGVFWVGGGGECPFYFYDARGFFLSNFPPAVLGPEMAAPVLRAPGIFWFFLNRLRGGGYFGFWGGGGVGKVPILFLWRGDFSDF